MAIDWYKSRVAQTVKDRGKDHPDYGFYLQMVGIASMKQGQYAEAEQSYTEALAATEQTLGKTHPAYFNTKHNLGKLYYYQGLYDKAEVAYLETKRLYEEDPEQKDDASYPIVLNNLGALYFMQGRYEEIKPLFLEILRINEKLVGKEHRNYATALNNLATIHGKLEEFDEAVFYLKEALNTYEKTVGKKHVQYTESMINLAYVQKKSGQLKEAEETYLKTLATQRDVLGSYHPQYEHTLNALGNLYYQQEQYAKAEPYYLESLQILRQQVDINFTHLSEKEKASYLATFDYRFEAFHSYALKRMEENPAIISESFNINLMTKGLLFDRQLKIRDRVMGGQDSALISLYDDWIEQRAYLSSLFSRSREELEAEGIDFTKEEEKANQLEKQLSSGSELFTKVREDRFHDWKEVKEALGKREAAVEIIRFRYFDGVWPDSVIYAALIVTPKTKQHPTVVVLGNGKALEAKHLTYYKNSIRYKVEDKNSYATYWKPIQDQLKKTRSVYLSSDGVYHYLNVQGFKNPDKGTYVLNDLDIYPITSSRELLKKTVEGRKGPIKVMGFPRFGAIPDKGNEGREALLEGQARNFFDGGAILPLPATEKEVGVIKELLDAQGYQVDEYVLEDATEAALKSWRDPMVVHIATHGYFLKDDASRFPAGFSGEELELHPLLRSGLLLANASKAIENGGDGVLTAYEAKGLHLDQTKLVVLSACETGLGEVKNGEGVYGLQRAFLFAGAESVLMSLWTVNDEATMELMTAFYRWWLVEKLPRKEAFRRAQNQLRASYPHPYYWAGFVMIGR